MDVLLVSSNQEYHKMFKNIETLIKDINKEDFINFYKNHSISQTAKKFYIKDYQVSIVAKYFDYSKSKEDIAKTKEQNNLQKYGTKNTFNIKERKNPFSDPEIIEKIKKTKQQNNSYRKAAEKSKETQILKYGSIEESYKQRWLKARQSNIEKYGRIVPKTHEQYLEDGKKSALTQKKNYYLLSEEQRKILQSKRLSGHYKDSKPNKIFQELLEKENIVYEKEYFLCGYYYDFKIDNILIEINPTITHNSTFGIFGKPKDKIYHEIKTNIAIKNGFRCIHIFDWDDSQKIVSLLKPREKIYARKCKIKEVDLDEARGYLNQYHLQGYARDSIRIGLYYNDELVSIMTFGKPRYNKNYEYELIRYCSSKNILGGSNKLFSYFTDKYNPESILSYCDKSKFSGQVYIDLGFHINGSHLGKHWYNPRSKQHITDNLLRQRGFDQLFGTNYGKGTSNEKLMINHGFLEIYDAGQDTYCWHK